jgi:hypothetical protein
MSAAVVASTVAEAGHAWLARGRGRHGEWARSTRERYERVVRRHVEESPDPALPALGSVRLADLTVDQVAEWSAANERVLAPTTAVIALITLNLVCRYAMPGSGWRPTPWPDWSLARSRAGLRGASASSKGAIWRRCWTARAPIDRCSRFWPTPGCGSAKRSG